jgi:hypothetical protein
MRRGIAGILCRPPIAMRQRREADVLATTSNALRRPQRSDLEGRVCSGVSPAGRYPTPIH